MQVLANVFITAIHGLRSDTSAVAVTEGPTTSSSSPCSVVSVCAACATGWSQCTFSFWLCVSRPFYNKSIICFNKLCVNMRERKGFLNALMPCRGRKIIYPAGSSTKYWNHISNFCFQLELLCVDGHMFRFQLLLLFLLMRWFSEMLNRKRMVSWCCVCYGSSSLGHIHLWWRTRWSHLKTVPSRQSLLEGRTAFWRPSMFIYVLVTCLWQSLTTIVPVSKQR